jgi:hypothetical protein
LGKHWLEPVQLIGKRGLRNLGGWSSCAH